MSFPFPESENYSNDSLWSRVNFHSRLLLTAHFQLPYSASTVATWLQRDPIAQKKRSFVTNHYHANLDICEDGKTAPFFSSMPLELNHSSAANTYPSPSRKRCIRFVKGESNGTTVEIWGSRGITLSFTINEKQHGSVYSDEWFGGVSWSNDESLVAYIADLPSKTSSKSTTEEKSSQESPHSTWGCELKGKYEGNSRGIFGEAYGKFQHPALFIADVENGFVELGASPDRLFIGQPQWGGDKIVCVARPTSSNEAIPLEIPSDLGLRYCYNRPSFLVSFKAPAKIKDVSLIQSSLEYLTDLQSTTDFCCTSPRFSLDNKSIIYISSPRLNTSGKNETDDASSYILPHNRTKMLRLITINENCQFSAPATLIDVPEKPLYGDFPGLYLHGLPNRPWINNRAISLTSTWGSKDKSLIVNLGNTDGILEGFPLDNSSIIDIFEDDKGISTCSTRVHDCFDNIILFSASSPSHTPKIGLVDLNHSSKQIYWLSSSEDSINALVKHQKTVRLVSVLKSKSHDPYDISFEIFDEKRHDSLDYFESVLIIPSKEPKALCVFPHGGPHTSSIAGFSVATSSLLALGFAVIFVNYRGSLGLGQASLETLLGNVGKQDVDEIIAATKWAKDEIRAENSIPSDDLPSVFIGGSHSGFLGAHLSLVPNLFKRTVLRNPVVNIASMVGSTDIPDWCFAEAGIGSDLTKSFSPNPSQMEIMYSKSPVALLSEKTKADFIPYTLLQVGGSDKRVPPTQSLEWRRLLTARFGEQACQVRWYQNSGHAIDEVPEGDDAWVHALDFICEIFHNKSS